jgi:hypothetical protein
MPLSRADALNTNDKKRHANRISKQLIPPPQKKNGKSKSKKTDLKCCRLAIRQIERVVAQRPIVGGANLCLSEFETNVDVESVFSIT